MRKREDIDLNDDLDLEDEDSEKSSGGKLFVVLGFLLAIIIVAILICAFLFFRQKNEPADPEPVTEEPIEDVVETAEVDDNDSLIQTFTFYSDSTDNYYFNYDEEVVDEDGNVWRATNVDYETLGTRDVIQHVEDLQVEELESIEDTYEYEAPSGETYQLENEQVYIAEEGTIDKVVTDTKTYERQYGEPSYPATMKIDYYNTVEEQDDTVTGRLVDSYVSVPGHWESVLKIDGTFRAASGSDWYTLEGSPNVLVSQSAATPEWATYKTDVLNSLGLNANHFRITSCEWNGEGYYSDDGFPMRDCTFYGDAWVSTYVAVYEGTGEAEGYTVKVFYRIDAPEGAAPEDITTVYETEATVTYEMVEAEG